MHENFCVCQCEEQVDTIKAIPLSSNNVCVYEGRSSVHFSFGQNIILKVALQSV